MTPVNFRRWAVAYAEILRWPVIPQVPRGKRPIFRLVPTGVSCATLDLTQIDYWWTEEPEANIGVVCRNVLVLDIDARHGGLETLERWSRDHGELPLTAREVTGREDGSHHLVFAKPGFATRGKLPGGIDVLTGNQCVTVAPSVHAMGGRYRWLVPPGPLAELPSWLAQLVRAPVVPPEQPPVPRNSNDCRVKRAMAYAAKLPPAVSGQHGHAATMRAAVRIVKGFDLSQEEAFHVLALWNQTCLPPWSERELKRKIAQAATRGRLPRGELLRAQSPKDELTRELHGTDHE